MKYGIFKKKSWYCLVICNTQDEAKKMIKNRSDLEIREIIEEKKYAKRSRKSN